MASKIGRNIAPQIAFDLAGVALSAGSACSSGRVEPSGVLLAMGLSPDDARATEVIWITGNHDPVIDAASIDPLDTIVNALNLPT